MITWLQNFIEKRGKWFFILLLLVVIVSFVPYISPTGESSLDFFPGCSANSQLEKDDYYGQNWNDPRVYNALRVKSQVSGFFGTSPQPSQYAQFEIQRKIYEEKISDSNEQERLSVKLFMETKIALLQAADTWGLPSFASSSEAMEQTLRSFILEKIQARLSDPGEFDAAKYEQAIKQIATSLKMKPSEVKEFLFDDFRADQVDKVLRGGGFALPVEAKIDLRENDLLWTFEAVSIDKESFQPEPVPFARIQFNGLPEPGTTLGLKYEDASLTFTFLETSPQKDANGSNLVVLLGTGETKQAQIAATRDNLVNALDKTGLEFEVHPVEGNASSASVGLALSLPSEGAPSVMPDVNASIEEALSISNELDDELRQYFEERAGEFMEPAQTGITILEFANSQYLNPPPLPSEQAIRAHWELHKDEFTKPAPIPAPAPKPTPAPEIKPSEEQPNLEKEGEQGPLGKPGESVRKSRVPKKEEAPEEKPSQQKGKPVPAAPEDKKESPKEPSKKGPEPVQPSKPDPATNVPKSVTPVDSNAQDQNASNLNKPVTSKPDGQSPIARVPLTFEEARPQIIERLLEAGRAVEEKKAAGKAKAKATQFIDDLHALSKKLVAGGSDPLKARQDDQVTSLIKRYQLEERPVFFTDEEIDTYSLLFGLDPKALNDMLKLSPRRFHSEAKYATRQGIVVLLLDARIEPQPMKYEDQLKNAFREFLGNFRTNRKNKAFQELGDEIAKSLTKSLEEGGALEEISEKVDSRLSYHTFEATNESSLRRDFTKHGNQLLIRQINAQQKLNNLKESVGDRNATDSETAQIEQQEALIKELQDNQVEIKNDNTLASELFEHAKDSTTKVGELTQMVTGAQSDSGIFVFLKEIILEIDPEESALVEDLLNNMEQRRSSLSRENILRDWISKGRSNL